MLGLFYLRVYPTDAGILGFSRRRELSTREVYPTDAGILGSQLAQKFAEVTVYPTDAGILEFLRLEK